MCHDLPILYQAYNPRDAFEKIVQVTMKHGPFDAI